MNIPPEALSALRDILLGIIANGLTTFIAHLGRKGRDIFEPNLRERLLVTDEPLARTLQIAVAAVAKSLTSADETQLHRMRLFLASPDVEAIVRQIYSTRLSVPSIRALSEQPSFGSETIRQEFVASLSLYVDLSPHDASSVAREVFNSLLAGCDRALDLAVERGSLAAHDAKDAIRHRMVLDELATVQKILALLSGPAKPDIDAIIAFEVTYRRQVGERHGFITPPHFDAARKLPIDTLYVAPNVTTVQKAKNEEAVLLKTADFLCQIYRAVVLGNPGGGKSTFAQKVCYDLASNYEGRLFGGRRLTPVLVVLREFGAEKVVRRCSVAQFVEECANTKYQVLPPAGAFEYLLLNGRIVVIFDGLDELLDTAYRNEIASDIESFCSRYPAVPVLVTSREVGYEQAPLDERRFEVFRLAPFDEAQVRSYAEKWFAADLELTKVEQEQKSRTFLAESQIVADLRSNPLMLALMCNIYRGENYIPRNRPDVYEKCAMMLFERWDKSRGIMVALPFEAHISPAMKFLAFWIYSDPALQIGVSERQLIAKAAEYLRSWRFEDQDEAEAAAREFIEFCRGRAWVFTDTGTRREGEGLFQFTHRTFLEYFTAAHLVRIYPTPQELGAFLTSKIARGEWDMVAQLAFQIQNRNIEGASDRLLLGLVEGVITGRGEAFQLVHFAGRCLEFMIPRPSTTRRIVSECLRITLEDASEGLWIATNGGRTHRGIRGGTLLGVVEVCAEENRATVAAMLETTLVERIRGADQPTARVAAEAAFGLVFWVRLVAPRRDPEVLRFWGEVRARTVQAAAGEIRALASSDLRICMEGVFDSRVSVEELVRWHGLRGLFSGVLYRVAGLDSPSMGEIISQRIEVADGPEEIGEWVRQVLTGLGQLFEATPPPWLRRAELVGPEPEPISYYRTDMPRTPLRVLGISGDAAFGLCALYGVLIEMLQGNGGAAEAAGGGRKDPVQVLGRLATLWSTRVKGGSLADAERLVRDLEMSVTQASLVLRWCRKEADFLEP